MIIITKLYMIDIYMLILIPVLQMYIVLIILHKHNITFHFIIFSNTYMKKNVAE